MKADHATWETGLVIPENTKTVAEQTLDVMLRIETLLEQLLGQRNVVALEGDIADVMTGVFPTETPFMEAIGGEAPKKKTKKATNGK